MVSPNPSSASIGIFDSGFGGLTVMRAVKKLLPNENIIYLGDAARLPYGNKSADTVVRYTLESSQFLISQNIKILIIACHTASSIALPALTTLHSLPVIGMVNPCLPALNSKNGKIAILGTHATISSQIYQNALKRLTPNTSVSAIACPLFVPLVEEGFIDSPITQESIRHYLLPVKEQEIDTVLLACTHYPLLQSLIQDFLGANCRLIDPAVNCAESVKGILNASGLLNAQAEEGNSVFYTTDDPEKFQHLGAIFLGNCIPNVQRVNL